MILREYPYAKSVFVWGGEEIDPPQYGRVFISIRPVSNFRITDSEKSYIRNKILKPKNVLTIDPILVDPEFLFLNADIHVEYDSTATRLTSDQIATFVKLAVVAYDAFNLDNFDSDFRYSKFVSNIDASDISIRSSMVDITMQKRVRIVSGTESTYIVKFGNRIYHPHDGHSSVFWSENFQHKNSSGKVVSAYIQDDGFGNLSIFQFDTNDVIVKQAGIIDYEKGSASIKYFNPVSIPDVELKFYAKPIPSSDIFANESTVLKMDFSTSDSIRVQVKPTKR
jgi:hypothetical protein